MLMVGSGALVCRLGGDRMPKDLDYICTHEQAKYWHDTWWQFKTITPNPTGTKLVGFGGLWSKPIELELAWPNTSAALILLHEPSGVASLNMQLLLKMSHRYLKHSPFFEKTRNDILLLRKLGAKIEQPMLLALREKETYNYPHPRLNQDKNSFFDPNQLTYVYDHDSIHLAMAHDPLVPAYKKFQTHAVKVSRDLWEPLSDEIKLHSVMEEAYVLALERSQIPHRGTIDPFRSYRIALQRLSSSISSGWWREWAWEHYDDALTGYNPAYLDKFDAAVNDGIVKKDLRF